MTVNFVFGVKQKIYVRGTVCRDRTHPIRKMYREQRHTIKREGTP